MVAKTVQSEGIFFWKPSQIDPRQNLINSGPTKSKAGLGRRLDVWTLGSSRGDWEPGARRVWRCRR